MAKQKVSVYTHYDEVYLDIVVGYYEGTEEEAERNVQMDYEFVLKAEGLYLLSSDSSLFITDNERERYQFEGTTKELGPPIALEDLDAMSEEERMALLSDDRYMLSAEDFETMPWTLSEAYALLRSQYPSEDSFSFSSLSFGIKPCETSN